MNKTVTIVDYGIGNVLSVKRSLLYFNAEVELTSDPEKIANASRLILPGVGAFGKGMEELEKRSLVAPIKSFSQKGNPFLGICLGMQMMLTDSEEFGHHHGLNLIEGNVCKIPSYNPQNHFEKIPLIGWYELSYAPKTSNWENSPLKETPTNTSVYFVHSYRALTKELKHTIAQIEYNELPITAAIKKDNLFGFQFHPEKSGPKGLEIIKNFLEL